jgi:hopene-associated glycosyltransferase HpnB
MTMAIGALALLIWIYLLLARGGFWRARERDDRDEAPEPAADSRLWPSVVAVVPARDEADVIARSIGSLLAQDYPGPFRVILVDDNSGDGTGEVARNLDGDGRLEVLAGAPLPAGWTGKLWAQSQGVARATEHAPEYLLLTDADIAHAPETLRKLVARAEARGLVLTSLMAQLTVETWAERLLIPAFVFFFAMLYPFAWVNDPGRRTAAAAGGVMLARRTALEAAGGLEAIRWKIIDDCSLGALMKRQGPIWLGLTDRARSLRPYSGVGEIGRMVSRSAYAQLNFSPWLLIGTVAGMAIVYLAAPGLAILAAGPARWAGIAAWGAMTLAFQPMLRFYGRSPLWGLALPVIGALYTGFTIQSALDSWRGRGGQWKGRAQALETGALLSHKDQAT